ncbi:hypothetical protein BAUCODRAFT_508298 [Baudoinia panamericana UAMH 10762]|uniref:Uncharacterized protein n=1 Tax=Baudoinia panamericana (strain UAMH 10762) TaxID=717646 RepID=M2LNI0_BAUPA|nr:uncharacterized protein BAUCODRAFT_508298 [Baudoinia panamericana UAMH 10762]EMC95912.1 hypothetical protein BAUCODRAFT_508298 [Baudoinia panamericana UAMH 10762]
MLTFAVVFSRSTRPIQHEPLYDRQGALRHGMNVVAGSAAMSAGFIAEYRKHGREYRVRLEDGTTRLRLEAFGHKVLHFDGTQIKAAVKILRPLPRYFNNGELKAKYLVDGHLHESMKGLKFHTIWNAQYDAVIIGPAESPASHASFAQLTNSDSCVTTPICDQEPARPLTTLPYSDSLGGLKGVCVGTTTERNTSSSCSPPSHQRAAGQDEPSIYGTNFKRIALTLRF